MPAMDSSPIPFPNRTASRDYTARYAMYQTRCGNCFQQQTLAIADCIDELLNDYYVYVTGLVLPPQKYIIDNAYCAGLLYPVLQVEPHACFERIVDLANLETARLVGVITADCRLPGPQRHRDLTGRLYDSPLQAQVISFSQILIQTREIVAHTQKSKKRLKAHREWMLGQMEVLAALRKIREDEFFQASWQKCYDELVSLVKTCDHTAQRERIKANVLKNHGGVHRRPSTQA